MDGLCKVNLVSYFHKEQICFDYNVSFVLLSAVMHFFISFIDDSNTSFPSMFLIHLFFQRRKLPADLKEGVLQSLSVQALGQVLFSLPRSSMLTAQNLTLFYVATK